MPTPSLFDVGFPGPSPTAQEIDSLPSRLAQAQGVKLAATQRLSGLASAAVEPAAGAADATVEALVAPAEAVLSGAQATAQGTLLQAQNAAVQALQAPLKAAAPLGYKSAGTPLIMPPKPKRKRGGISLPVASPPPPPPPATIVSGSVTWTIWFNCSTREVAAMDDGQLKGPYTGFHPPAPWAGGYGFVGTQPQLIAYLGEFGSQMFTSVCPNYVPPPGG
jgi:hypothetical protein